jgi:hypothetical protein
MLRSAGYHTQEYFFHSWLCGSALTVQQGSGRCAERDKPVKQWREEMLREAALSASDSLVVGFVCLKPGDEQQFSKED